MNTLRINGTELACAERGEGETLILVHGAVGDLRSWENVATKLATRFHVVSYSRRWHYPSFQPVSAGSYTVETHTADLLAVLKHFGPAHVVGHSYGAAIGTVAVLQAPELVKTLTLAEPALFSLLQGSEHGRRAAEVAGLATSRVPALLQQGKRDRALTEFLDVILGPSGAERISTLGLSIMRDNLHTLAPMLEKVNAESPFTTQHAAQISMPTLLLDGAQTPAIFRITANELNQAIPDVQRITLPEVSHGLHLENPDSFTHAVLPFLIEAKSGVVNT